jgi:hypothetical protein
MPQESGDGGRKIARDILVNVLAILIATLIIYGAAAEGSYIKINRPIVGYAALMIVGLAVLLVGVAPKADPDRGPQKPVILAGVAIVAISLLLLAG